MTKNKKAILTILSLIPALILIISFAGCSDNNNKSGGSQPPAAPEPPPKPKLKISAKFDPAIVFDHAVTLNNVSGEDLTAVHISIKFVGEDAQPVVTRYWASWPLGKEQIISISLNTVKNIQEIDVTGTADQGVIDSSWNIH